MKRFLVKIILEFFAPYNKKIIKPFEYSDKHFKIKFYFNHFDADIDIGWVNVYYAEIIKEIYCDKNDLPKEINLIKLDALKIISNHTYKEKSFFFKIKDKNDNFLICIEELD